MKKNLLYIGLMATAMLFTACSGDSSSEQSNPQGSAQESADEQMETTNRNEKVMELNKAYTMSKGETIKKISSTSKIVLETSLETGETTATLVEGEAKIKKSSIAFF